MRFEERRLKPFQTLGTEESHNIESYERKIHGTPEVEPQHQYSYSTFTERRTTGRDENGDIVVRIEKDPKDPVRPVTPVRAVTPVGPAPEEHLLKPVEPFDTLPLSIPRIDIRKNGGSRASNSPRSVYSHNEQASPRSGISMGNSSRSGRSGPISPRSISSSSSQNAAIPMKKIIRKSRWVSIHDGRPVSPFVETVTYEPKFPYESSYVGRRSATPNEALRSRQSPNYDERVDRRLSDPETRYESELRYTPENRYVRREPRYISECAYIIENPLYRD